MDQISQVSQIYQGYIMEEFNRLADEYGNKQLLKDFES